VGQLVELSLSDVGLAVAGHLGLLAEASLIDEPWRGRFGNDLYGTFRARLLRRATAGGLSFFALTARQWRRLVVATGLDAEVATLESRLNLDLRMEGIAGEARREITELLSGWIAGPQPDRCTIGVRCSRCVCGVHIRRSSNSSLRTLARRTKNPNVRRGRPSWLGALRNGQGLADFRFWRGPSGSAAARLRVLGQHTEEIVRSSVWRSSA